MSTRVSWAAALVLALGVASLGSVACGPSSEEPVSGDVQVTATSEPLVVYSGRNEKLIGPLLERFETETGIATEVRYGDTAELAAVLLDEADASPADVFVSQDAAALGAVGAAGSLKSLPETVLGNVPARFGAGAARTWVGVSGRARSLVYNTVAVEPEDLPQSLEELGDERYRGRFGLAPTNASFQAHMAVYRVVQGEEALATLLVAIAANEPKIYPKNTPIVEAAAAGEIDFGLVNHYYTMRALAEDPSAPVANFFQGSGGASGFVNVAGVGVLSERPEALRLVEFLLSTGAQEYFAQETFEYPLIEGIAATEGLMTLDELSTPDVDFAAVSAAFEPTLEAIRAAGLVP